MKRMLMSRLGVAASVLAVALVATAYAAIPADDGTIHGCFAQEDVLLGALGEKGDLRIVESKAECRADEQTISWSQEGPRGAPGPQGEPGQQGETGPRGPAGNPASALMAGVAQSAERGLSYFALSGLSAGGPAGRLASPIAADTTASNLAVELSEPAQSVVSVAVAEADGSSSGLLCVVFTGGRTCEHRQPVQMRAGTSYQLRVASNHPEVIDVRFSFTATVSG